MKTKLTKRGVDALKPQNRVFVAWDADLANFGLKVTPKGKKVYIAQYRHQGRRRRFTIGEHGPLTPDQARTRAKKILAQAAEGEDPAGRKTDTRKAPTVNELADRYMSQHAEVKKKPSSITKDRSLLNRLIRPALGKQKAAAVTTKDVAQFHHSLRKTPTQANRCLALMSKMFSLAEAWGLRTQGTNPCKYVERYKENKRERYLSADELARLGKALTEAEQEGSEVQSGITAIRLLIFTGCRRGEILNLKWEHVDFGNGHLNLPDTKTGYKLVPLGKAALEVLSNTQRQAGNPYVCPGRKPMGPLVGLPRIWARIKESAGLSDVRLHDLRHSFASVAAGQGVSLPVIGALLGHTQAATTQRYAHLANDPLKSAADQITSSLDQAMKAPVRDKVIPINRDQ